MSHITRPRPSLSCAICRRRKVRCGKEQPKCGNCKRMNESCVYESDVYNSQSKTAAKGFNKGKSGSDRRKTPATQNSNWTSSSESSEKSTSLQASSTESNTSSSDYSTQSRKNIPLSTDPSTFGQTLYSNGQASTEPSTADAPVPFFGQSGSNGQGNNATDMSNWDAGDEDVSGLAVDSMPTENPRPGPPPQTHDGQTSSTARKRQRAVFDASTYPKHARPYGQLQSNEAPESQSTRLDSRQQTQFLGSKGDVEAGDEEEIIPLPRYLYARNKVNRHVESTFWALTTGHEDVCDELFDDIHRIPEGVTFVHTDPIGLASVLKSLPTKPVCDMLAFAFWVGVHPLHPLVHAPTFRAAYDSFWQWCQTNDGQVPNQKLVEDPTFLCLMFAVLYSGAVAASSSFWASPALQDFNRETTVGQLSAMLSSSLLLCQHAKHPTFHTLVASLLGFGCSTQVAEPLEELTFISTTVRIAQSMGLHREATLWKLDVATTELHRRVWWHIVWLDVRLSIEHGSQTCCGTAGANFDTKIVVDSCDEDVTRSSPDFDLSLPPPTPSVRSTLIPLAVGRFETARFENMLINHLHRNHQLALSDFGYFMGLVQNLHSKLDTLIARLPGTAPMGKGTIPSRLANASPLTHEKLYGHSSSEPTVFGAWAKIMLSLLKLEALILLKRCLLGHASVDTEQSRGSWNSVVQLCTSHLRQFLQLSRVPAFAPYSWFCPTRFLPLQPVMLIAAYLQHNPQSPVAHLGLYLIDEVIDVFDTDDEASELDHRSDGHDHSYISAEKSGTRVAAALVLFKKLRARLNVENDGNTPLEKTSAANAAKVAPRSQVFMPENPVVVPLGSRTSRYEAPSSLSPKRQGVFQHPPLLTPPAASSGSGSYDDGSSMDLALDNPDLNTLLGQDMYSGNDFDFGPDVSMAGARDAAPFAMASTKSAEGFSLGFGDSSDYFHGWSPLKSRDGGGRTHTSTVNWIARERADEGDVELRDVVVGKRPSPTRGIESRPASSFTNRILGDDLWVD